MIPNLPSELPFLACLPVPWYIMAGCGWTRSGAAASVDFGIAERDVCCTSAGLGNCPGFPQGGSGPAVFETCQPVQLRVRALGELVRCLTHFSIGRGHNRENCAGGLDASPHHF